MAPIRSSTRDLQALSRCSLISARDKVRFGGDAHGFAEGTPRAQGGPAFAFQDHLAMVGCLGWCGRAGALHTPPRRSHAATPPPALSHPSPGRTVRLPSLQKALHTIQPPHQQQKLASLRIVLPPLHGHFVLGRTESLSSSRRLCFSPV